MQWLERLAILSKLEGSTGKYTHSRVSAVESNETGSNVTVDISSENDGRDRDRNRNICDGTD